MEKMGMETLSCLKDDWNFPSWKLLDDNLERQATYISSKLYVNMYIYLYTYIYIVPRSLAKRHSSMKAFLVKYIATFPKAFLQVLEDQIIDMSVYPHVL